MSQPQFSAQAALRSNVLYQYKILDTPPEPVFDNLVRLAAHSCHTPIALINFIDGDRQWFKASIGWNFPELPLNFGFCPYTILQPNLLIVPDASQDMRFANNPLVTNSPHIRFYAGVPLTTPGGYSIGTLCVMDRRWRALNQQQVEKLSTLARRVFSHLESRRQLKYASSVLVKSQQIRDQKYLSPSLKAIFNSNLQAVLFIDWECKVQRFNKTATNWVKIVYDKTLKEGESIYDFIEPNNLNLANSYITATFKGKLVQVEHSLKRSDKTQYWFEFNFSPVVDAYSRVIGICLVAINIDKQKIAIDALAKSEERFRSLVQNSSDIIIILEANGTVNYVSPAMERILGYKPTDLLGNNSIAYIHPEDVLTYKAKLTEIIQHPRAMITNEVRVLHKNGSWVFIETVANNQLDNPSVKGLVVNARDITERKQTQQKLQASLQEKEVLLQEIHHRVKNNLQVISSLLNLQAGYINDKQAIKIFKEGQNRIKAIALLHENLYRHKSLSQIKFPEYVQQIAINLFGAFGVNSSAISLTIQVEDISLGIDTAIPCGLIINELVSNCLKHAFPPEKCGEIWILLMCNYNQSNKIILTVQDNGIGFPSHIDFRNTESLGLQLVNALAAQIQGTVKFTNKGITEVKVEFVTNIN